MTSHSTLPLAQIFHGYLHSLHLFLHTISRFFYRHSLCFSKSRTISKEKVFRSKQWMHLSKFWNQCLPTLAAGSTALIQSVHSILYIHTSRGFVYQAFIFKAKVKGDDCLKAVLTSMWRFEISLISTPHSFRKPALIKLFFCAKY